MNRLQMWWAETGHTGQSWKNCSLLITDIKASCYILQLNHFETELHIILHIRLVL